MDETAGLNQGAAPARAGVVADDLMSRLGRLAVLADEEKRALPCYPFVAEAGRENLVGGAEACTASGGFQRCRFVVDKKFCARERVAATYRDAEERMRLGGVPALFVDRVLAGVPGAPSQPLGSPAAEPFIETEALRLVRAFLAERGVGVPLDDGERVTLVGNEWLLVMSGLPGCGKSLAAAYAIARFGGMWLKARALNNVKLDLSDYGKAGLLVIDDLGTEWAGETRFVTDRAAGLLEERYDAKRRTIITTNLRRRRRKVEDASLDTEEPPQFVERYGERTDDRARDRGRFVVLTEGSLRGRL